jgi:hypothetical protein
MHAFTMGLIFWSLPRDLVCILDYFRWVLMLILSAGVRIIFLPPYSPDFNPIEEAISKIKAWIRRNYELFSPGDGILFDVQVAMDVITPEDAEGYFFHAGYF